MYKGICILGAYTTRTVRTTIRQQPTQPTFRGRPACRCHGEGTLDGCRSRSNPQTARTTGNRVRGFARNGSVTDWTHAFDAAEAAIVARVLLWLALVETDGSAEEAQLHALAELAEWGLVTHETLQDVGQLTRAGLHGSSVEYFDYLESLQDNESQPLPP